MSSVVNACEMSQIMKLILNLYTVIKNISNIENYNVFIFVFIKTFINSRLNSAYRLNSATYLKTFVIFLYKFGSASNIFSFVFLMS